MPENDLLKRLLDAGVAFTQMTQQRAEAIVRDLISAGEVQAEQAQTAVAELLDRSRNNTERLLEVVRTEIRNQMTLLNVVTKDAVDRVEAQVGQLREQVSDLLPGGRRAPAKKAAKTAKKALSAAKKTAGAAKKKASGAKKSAAKKKAAPKKTGGAKRSAKKSTAKKAAR